MLTLQGKIALITGSTQGIGYAAAKALADSGASVVLNGRDETRVKEAVVRLEREVPGAKVTGVAADLSTSAGAKKIFSKVLSVDVLINNVAIFEPKPFFEIPDEDWERFFQVNVMSAVRMSRHYVPGMVKNKWGRVMFISSESAVQIPAEMVHYGMTKTALLAISRGLAETVAGSGVTVNAVLPGPTSSEGVEQFVERLAKHQGKSVAQMEEAFFKDARPSSLLQRFITPAEVASLINYLASPAASATTGSALRVDGGVVRSIL